MQATRVMSWVVGLALAMGGCIERSNPAAEGEADGASPDAAYDDPSADARTPDVAPPDATPTDAAGADVGGPPGDGTWFIDRGRCFEHTPSCGRDEDCDPGLYRGCMGGRCHLDLPCGCASDDDCAPGDLCLTNERVCGVCLPAPAPCPDGACPGGEICVDGWCRDNCPGHGDGPPLDCRGEPDLGRCDGGWAYLREAGTCVPVDSVGCVRGRNTFESRGACLTHCRGEPVCSATVSGTAEDGERRVVECLLSHGPGACVALAHCLCELTAADLPREQRREQLRRCASWWTVPRGAITFADYCGEASLTAVVDRMRADGFLDELIGAETTVELSPGCADVATDRAIGPMCEDGVQNGWETGIDCGIEGCAACP